MTNVSTDSKSKETIVKRTSISTQMLRKKQSGLSS